MMHPHTKLAFINDQIGHGVFATQFIPQGTVTWILDELDQKLDPTYVSTLDPVRHERVIHYTFRDRQARYILCWDSARFVNHSFNANCLLTSYEFDIAVKDIYPGDEMTNDYGLFNVEEPITYNVEPDTSRFQVLPDDLLYYHQDWDQQIAAALANFAQVEQPLAHLIHPEVLNQVHAVVQGKIAMASTLNCYCGHAQRSLAALPKKPNPHQVLKAL